MVATAILPTFINTWNEFLHALILMNNTSKMTVVVALRPDGAEILDWGDMMAASALVVLPCHFPPYTEQDCRRHVGGRREVPMNLTEREKGSYILWKP